MLFSSNLMGNVIKWQIKQKQKTNYKETVSISHGSINLIVKSC